MSDVNPYAAPKSRPAKDVEFERLVASRFEHRYDAYWRDGDHLVVRPDTTLPASVCLVTGTPTTSVAEPWTLTWVPRGVYLCLFAMLLSPIRGMLVFFAVYFTLRYRVQLHYAVSETVRKQLRTYRWATRIALASAVVLFVTDPSIGLGWFAPLPLAIAPVCIRRRGNRSRS